ncbi:MAG: type II secretion system protein GspK, partial [Aeoliella sp.]
FNLNAVLVADARDPEAALGRQLLMAMPGMTESIADAILDWIDTDDDPRDFGAERSYYSGLSTPYEPQNGPLESIDQLLRVRDVTPELLYGLDRNRNFTIDAAEAQTYAIEYVDNTTGSMNRGWVAYLTLRSAERNLRADDTPKIDVNGEDLEELRDQLTEVLDDEQANFIIAFRQGGPYEEDPAAAGEGETIKNAGSLQFDFEQGGSVPINSILDLVGVRTRVVETGQTERTIVETPFPDEPGAMGFYLPILMENLTANPEEVIPGRLNINQAPRMLLDGISRALPTALRPEAVEQILANRAFEPGTERPEQAYETWILTMGFVTLDEMKQLMPLVTAGGDVYRAQIVGYYEAEGPYTRLEATIDASTTSPEIVSVHDLTPLGAGFTVEQLGFSE